MLCDSFEYNRNPIDIIGSITVTITKKMKYAAIIIDPFIIAFGFAPFSVILTMYVIKKTRNLSLHFDAIS